jgi:hypothetical protein
MLCNSQIKINVKRKISETKETSVNALGVRKTKWQGEGSSWHASVSLLKYAGNLKWCKTVPEQIIDRFTIAASLRW